jgi:hypothetical protein
MTDEELIAQLRGEPTWGGIVVLTKQDANRIEALTAKLAKAVRLIDLAVELARWDLNPKLRDDMIDFTTETKGESHE